MKALKIVFLSPLFFSSLVSCNHLPNKVSTLFGFIDKENKTAIRINTTSDFVSMMENHESFVLIQTVDTCECSATFLNQCVNPYIHETGLIIYWADYQILKNTNYSLSLRNSSPTFHVIVKGNKLGNLEKVDNGSDAFFYQYTTFKTFMDEHIAKPFVFEIDEAKLDELFMGNEPFTIYYAKRGCEECDYLQNEILNDYAQSHFDLKMIYFIDQNIAKLDPSKYQLSEAYEWGYGSKGAFPLIHYVKPATHDKRNDIQQGFTFGNDILNNEYVIEKSYFDENRLNKIKYLSDTNKDNLLTKRTFNENETKIEGTYRTLKKEINRQRYEIVFNEFINYLNQ